MTFTFYLGCSQPAWISKTDVPLMISFRQLKKRKKPFDQTAPLVIDSGGFTELTLFGEWQTSPEEYIEGLCRLQQLGLEFEWVAQQDWMCEPHMIERTGLSVEEHQRRTVENFLELKSLGPDLPIIPVIQGWELKDYLRCVKMFEDAGVDLTKEQTVGVGSVCRRQNTTEAEVIFKTLKNLDLNIHGFGVKTDGLARYSQMLDSSDSLAWTWWARSSGGYKRCSVHAGQPKDAKPITCSSCFHFALEWREKILNNQSRFSPMRKVYLDEWFD